MASHRSNLATLAVLAFQPFAALSQFNILHMGAAGSSFEAIDFPSPSVGYAAGKDGSVFKTTDAGFYWDPLTTGSGAYLFDVSFLNEDVGFVSGGGATMLRTTDGGANWTPLTLPFTECIYQVQPISTSLVYAAGWGGYFFRSIDGGDNWTIAAIDPGWQGWVFGMQFLNADSGFVAEADGRIYRTVDGGMSWTQSTTTTTNTLRGISMGSATTGFAVGFFGTVQKTTDGGASWSTVSTGYPNDSYYGAHFTDALNGVICGGFYSGGNWQGVIMRTDDGGATWDRIYTGFYVLNGVTINSGHIFAVGANEVILSDGLSTGIVDASTGPSLSVHPVPACVVLNVMNGGAELDADLLEPTGRTVARFLLLRGQNTIEISALAPGAYLLRTGNGTVVRVVKD